MSFFQKNKGPIDYESIHKVVGSDFNSAISKKIKFRSLKGSEDCTGDDLSFIYDNVKNFTPNQMPKGIIISNNRNDLLLPDCVLQIKVSDVHLAVAKLSNLFYREFTLKEKLQFKKSIFENQNDISTKSIIKSNCLLGKNIQICDGVIINEGCIIGDNVKIGPNTIIQNSIIGNDVVIESNCSIGQPGFGFAFDQPRNIKIFHIGRVIIQDNVYIGSNCTIDRGSFSDTQIAENVYIDNQVHIAHNVSVGFSTAIAGQTGIAGSAKIGNFVKIGGQVGIAGHISIGDYVEIAAKSGVRNNIDNNKKVMGDPAINMFTFLKQYKKVFN